MMKSFILILVMIIVGYLVLSKFEGTETSYEDNNDVKEDSISQRYKEDSGLGVSIASERSHLNSESFLNKSQKALTDEEYKQLLKSGSFKEAISHLMKKSEEHIGGQPSKEDFITKLDIITQYIDYDPSILKRDFDFFVAYYSLNAYDRREERMDEVEELLDETYQNESKNTRYCLGFFRESGKRNINYSNLASAVNACANEDTKRNVVFDYVNFLREAKDENFAMQEYTKMRLMHNELPEYGDFYKN